MKFTHLIVLISAILMVSCEKEEIYTYEFNPEVKVIDVVRDYHQHSIYGGYYKIVYFTIDETLGQKDGLMAHYGESIESIGYHLAGGAIYSTHEKYDINGDGEYEKVYYFNTSYDRSSEDWDHFYFKVICYDFMGIAAESDIVEVDYNKFK